MNVFWMCITQHLTTQHKEFFGWLGPTALYVLNEDTEAEAQTDKGYCKSLMLKTVLIYDICLGEEMIYR